MQDLVKYFESEIPDILKPLSKEDFEDQGLSGLHLKKNPILFKGLRIQEKSRQSIQNELNRSLDRKPLEVILSDKSVLRVFAIDLVVSPGSKVYLADVLDGEFLS